MDKTMEIFPKEKRKFQFYEKLREKYSVKRKSKSEGKNVSDYLFLLPDVFVLVCRLALEKRLSISNKLFMSAVAAYFMLPIDIIPDFVPFVGFLEDFILAIFAFDYLFKEIDNKIILDNWSGEADMLETTKKVVSLANKQISSKVLKKIKKIVNSKGGSDE